jgi:sarcosine oxidase subunit beta
MINCDVLIIGAGSVGLPLAMYCARRGLRTIVIDQHASWGRGQNRAAIGGIRATHSDPAKIKICQASLRIIQTMQDEQGIDLEWRRGGYLFVAYDSIREEALRQLLSSQQAAGLEISWIDPGHVRTLLPGIQPAGLRGGTYSPGDGYASPLLVASAFYRLARQAGAEFRFGEQVVAMDVGQGRINAVATDRERYSAGAVVNAAGAEAAHVAALAGIDLPVHPDCHEAGVTEPVQRFMEPMVVDIRPDDQSGNYYFYQSMTGQVIFCITPRPLVWGTDLDNTSGFLPLVLRRMVELYPRLRHLKVRRTWRGAYPMTTDGLPIVGWTAEYDNLLLAAGMCGQGFMLGPGLGDILAELLADGRAARQRHSQILDELSLYRHFSAMELLK